MTARELLVNQVTYLTYLLWHQEDRVDSEDLRPTYLCLQQVRDTDLSESALVYVRQVRTILEDWIRQHRPIQLQAARGVLFALRQAVATMAAVRAPGSFA